MAYPFASSLVAAVGATIPADVLPLVEERLTSALARYRSARVADGWAARVGAAVDAELFGREPVEALAALSLDDLAIAHAACVGDPAATSEVERAGIEPLPRWLARHRPTPEIVDELRQDLREKLLVGVPGGRPKLLEYKGRGPLGAWVRVMALRAFYDRGRSARGDRQVADDDALGAFVDPGDGPELAHLRGTYAAELRESFQAAARRLGTHERAVLRSHAIDGLTIDQIGALYQVHRATAARWIQQAKASLLALLREELARRLGGRPDACDSVVALVQSRIDLSLERVLRD